MKRRQKMTWYLCGMISAVLVAQLLSPALASAKRAIEVYNNGVSIYIDDVKLNPTNVNGNPVDIFVYNGTTYVPIRAISQGFGKVVQYDSATKNIYIGRHNSETPAAYLSQMDYFSGTSASGFHTATTETDNTGASHTNCITRSFDRTYLLNGQYTKIAGTMYQTYERRSDAIVIANKGIYIYGDGRLLYAYSPEMGTQGMMPVNFSVDLTGVLELRVDFDANANGSDTLSLGEVALWT